MKKSVKAIATGIILAGSLFTVSSDSSALTKNPIKPTVEVFDMRTAGSQVNGSWKSFDIPKGKVNFVNINGVYLFSKNPSKKEYIKSYTADTRITDKSLGVINSYVVGDMTKYKKGKFSKSSYIPTIKSTVSSTTGSTITVKLAITRGKAFKYSKKDVYLKYKRSTGKIMSKTIKYK